jgi:hypothetical protein
MDYGSSVRVGKDIDKIAPAERIYSFVDPKQLPGLIFPTKM